MGASSEFTFGILQSDVYILIWANQGAITDPGSSYDLNVNVTFVSASFAVSLSLSIFNSLSEKHTHYVLTY